MSETKNINKWVIYGSYGYTGRLISERAAQENKHVVLSGRNEEKLKQQAQQLNLHHRAADLNDHLRMDNLLNDAELVIHCAGPFHQTSALMLEACLRNRCHYLDITGEIQVFEAIKARNEEIKEAKIMAMPGTGFDVVPTDCLALFLKKKLPDAERLELAFMNLGGGISHGTAQTVADNLGKGGAIRENGRIIPVPAAYKTRVIDFGEKKLKSVSLPWGDVSTANFTTGIENIIVYTPMKTFARIGINLSRWIAPVLRLPIAKKLVKKWIGKYVTGPDKQKRDSGKSIVWGEVENNAGKKVTARLTTPETYRMTSLSTLLIAKKIETGDYKTGYQTPASVYGEDLILEIEHTSRELIESEGKP